MNKIFIVGHRGAPVEAPENTLISFRKAVEIGVDFIELDLRQTLDGEIIILHDATLDRTTNGSGRVSEKTFDEIRKLDAGGWFSPKFKGEMIPTLEEVLSELGGRTRFILELKVEGIEEKVVKQVCDMGLVDDTIILSGNWNILKRVKDIDPRFTLFADMPVFSLKGLRKLVENYVNIVSYHISKAEDYMIDCAHIRGLLVNVWPVNTTKEAEKAIKLGVDFITTDDPRKIRKIVKV
ncbi:MAG TPA: glycerophosphodiester phosphodiesterase [Thermoproteales archaeon]|nr:glycerophosphodiester phosphodiesterase [Thermoproteales archaeon]